MVKVVDLGDKMEGVHSGGHAKDNQEGHQIRYFGYLHVIEHVECYQRKELNY